MSGNEIATTTPGPTSGSVTGPSSTVASDLSNTQTERSSLIHPRYILVVSIGALLLSAAVVIWMGINLRGYAVDDAYITFRHAQNMVRGDGFSFNPGDKLLSTTSPLHALSLAFFSLLSFTGIPQVAIWLSVLALLLLCSAIMLIFIQQGEALTGLLCVSLLITQHWLYRFFPLETILVLALNTGAIALALRRRWGWAGFVTGIAMIGRPDSIIVAAILALYALVANKTPFRELWRYVAAAIVGYGIWLAFALFYFGTPFPNTLAAKSGFGTWTVFISNIWPKIIGELIPSYRVLALLLLIFAATGCIDLLRRRSPLLIFQLWALLHVLGYTILRIAYPFAWYYAPIILVFILLAAVGATAGIRFALYTLNRAYRPFGMALAGAIALSWLLAIALSMQATLSFVSTYQSAYFAGARDQVYRQVGQWLAENSNADATVALTEVGTIGYFSQRRLIDMMGLVTYEFRNLPKEGDYGQAIDTVQPDFIVATRGLPPDPQLLGLEGYTVVQEFPKGENNLFEDVAIYKLSQLQ